MTAAPQPMEGAARPMTAVKAAGYSSAAASGKFDPFAGAMAPSGPAAPLQKRSEASVEDKCKELERQVRNFPSAAPDTRAFVSKGAAVKVTTTRGGSVCRRWTGARGFFF
jgi:hypothetical protein